MLSTGFSTAVDNLIPQFNGTNLYSELKWFNADVAMVCCELSKKLNARKAAALRYME
jgi:hypothetical protein